MLKEEVLLAVYEEFAAWAQGMDFVCDKGCAACCTQNVTMTAVEGDLIHGHIWEQGQQAWFAERLQEKGQTGRPQRTTNQFAAACLAAEDSDPGTCGNLGPCPFLEQDVCTIYPVRPFACRSFASQHPCGAGQPAQAPEAYLSAVTAVMQVIEHLGQGEYWGNMLDVLAALSTLPENREYRNLLPAAFAELAQANLVAAQPLPGFLISPEEWEQVEPLLRAIFDRQVEGRRIEDILNGQPG